MKNRSQDIYDTGHADVDGDRLLPAGATQPIDDIWLRETRRKHRQTILFVIILAGFGILISVIAVQQYLLSTRPIDTTREPGPEPRMAREQSDEDSWDFELSPRAEMVLGEIEKVGVMEIPEDGEIPFDTRWVKQAAYHVVRAEKSYEDNEMARALDHYDRALRIFPELEGIERYRGLIYLQLQDYEAAAAAFRRESAKGAMSHGILNNLGVAHLALQDYQKAEQYFAKAIELKPNYAIAYLNLATLYVRTGDKQKAGIHFRKYLDLKPDDLKAAQSYANLLMEQNRWDEAAQLLLRIRDQAPTLAPAHFKLAQAMTHLGNREGAMVSLRRGAVLLDPRKALAMLSGAEFDEIRSDPEFQVLISDLSAPERQP